MAKSQHKAQSSVEYLIMVALTFALIVPGGILIYNYSLESGSEIKDTQIVQVGKALSDTAQSIFYYGQGSKTVVEVNLPENVMGAYIIDGRELVFNVTQNSGASEFVFFFPINVTSKGSDCVANKCNIKGADNRGVKKLKIEAVTKESVSIFLV